MHPLIVLGIVVAIFLLIFLVGPFLMRKKPQKDALTKSGGSSSADAAKSSGSGPK